MLSHSAGAVIDAELCSRREIDESWRIFARKIVAGKVRLENGAEPLPTSLVLRTGAEVSKAVRRKLRSGSVELGEALLAPVYCGKLREIARFDLCDTFLLMHCGRILQRHLERDLGSSVLGYRKGLSVKLALGSVADYLAAGSDEVQIFRADIRDFGISLRHAVVIERFADRFPDSALVGSLIAATCRFRYRAEGRVVSNVRGLPTGTFLQLLACNLYLHSLDRLIAQENGELLYLRFGDDLLLLSRSSAVMNRIVPQIEPMLQDLGLSLNTAKTVRGTLVKPHQVGARDDGAMRLTHFRYLGYEIEFDGTVRLPADKNAVLRKDLVRNLKATAALLGQLPQDERIRELRHAGMAFLSRDGGPSSSRAGHYLRNCSSARYLSELERWLAIKIVQISSGGRFRQKHLAHGVPALRERLTRQR